MLRFSPLVLVLLLGACQSTPEDPAPEAPEIIEEDGRCFGTDTAPARFETVTYQVLVSPEARDEAGNITSPARYQTRTEQRIAQERHEIRFETPCADAFTPDFIASVQRALAARGYYRGAGNGRLDRATGRAIRAFQRRFGPDSTTLSLLAAQRLGLVALSKEQLDGAS